MLYGQYELNFLVRLLPFLLTPMGLILLFSPQSSPAERIASLNVACAGVALAYLVLYPKIWKKPRPNASAVFWLNLFTVFQLWILLPIFLHSSEQWQKRINRFCKWCFILFGCYVGISFVWMFLKSLLL